MQINTHAPTFVASNKVTLYAAACLYGAHTTCAETAAVSRGISYVAIKLRCKQTTSVRWIFRNTLCKAAKIQRRIRLNRGGSARKQRIALHGCHCKTLSVHFEMTPSASVHIQSENKKRKILLHPGQNMSFRNLGSKCERHVHGMLCLMCIDTYTVALRASYTSIK